MNLIISELAQHKKILNAFRDLPTDLKKLVRTFHVSTSPVLTCRFCNWAVVPPYWGMPSPCHYCFCCHFVPGTKRKFH